MRCYAGRGRWEERHRNRRHAARPAHDARSMAAVRGRGSLPRRDGGNSSRRGRIPSGGAAPPSAEDISWGCASLLYAFAGAHGDLPGDSRRRRRIRTVHPHVFVLGPGRARHVARAPRPGRGLASHNPCEGERCETQIARRVVGRLRALDSPAERTATDRRSFARLRDGLKATGIFLAASFRPDRAPRDAGPSAYEVMLRRAPQHRVATQSGSPGRRCLTRAILSVVWAPSNSPPWAS